MTTVWVTSYSHIDCTFLVIPAIAEKGLRSEHNIPCTREEAIYAFTQAGWEGDGQLGFIWLPPFLFSEYNAIGACIWHVKQSNNGTSFLCGSEPYVFAGIEQDSWLKVSFL